MRSRRLQTDLAVLVATGADDMSGERPKDGRRIEHPTEKTNEGSPL
jgi:hypothetical protein